MLPYSYKLFCAYAFTGENLVDVSKRMQLVVKTLHDEGHGAYCNLFDEECQALTGVKAICSHAFEVLKEHDAVIAIVTSERRSVGQLMEIGAALILEKPIFLLQHKSAVGKSYLPEIAKHTNVWETSEELSEGLREVIGSKVKV